MQIEFSQAASLPQKVNNQSYHAQPAVRLTVNNDNTPIRSVSEQRLFTETDFTLPTLGKAVFEAEKFMKECLAGSTISNGRGLTVNQPQDWAVKLVRKKGIAGAVVEKLGSNAFCKRRPEDASPYINYVKKQEASKEPLVFRIGFGPVKNVNKCESHQTPDLGEMLTFSQLTRALHAVASVYPYGVKAEIVPDDIRSGKANHLPQGHITRYIDGLKTMVGEMGLQDMISIENGQSRLYRKYNVPAFEEKAAESLAIWRKENPEEFAAKWESSKINAGQNLLSGQKRTESEIEISAWNYLVAHRAEVLSGLWSAGDAFPIRYGRHENSFQLYTTAHKKTKLPWQASMPLELLENADAPSSTRTTRTNPSPLYLTVSKTVSRM